MTPLSRTHDFFLEEGSPTEPAPVFSLIKLIHPSLFHGSFLLFYSGLPVDVRKLGADMKMLLLGGLVGLALGVGLTVFYFALAEFFRAQAKAFEATQKAAENGNENAKASAAGSLLN